MRILHAIRDFILYVFFYRRNRAMYKQILQNNQFLQRAYTFMTGNVTAQLRVLTKEQNRMIGHLIRGEYKQAKIIAGVLQLKWLELEKAIAAHADPQKAA